MKKILASLFLGGLLASCTTNDPTMGNSGQNPNGYEPAIRGYLSVNMTAPGGLYSRADGKYQYGTENENYVNEVRFFFFDNEGKGVPVRKNPLFVNTPSDGSSSGDGSAGSNAGVPEYFSYYDWDPTPSDNNNTTGTEGDEFTDTGNVEENWENTIEKILTAMIVLSGPEEVDFPTQVLAVINPSSAVKDLCNTDPTPDLKDVQGTVSNYFDGLITKNFVMSSSVYKDENGDIIVAQPISKDNYGVTQVEARNKPITLYVERVLARLDLDFDITYKALEDGTIPQTIDLGNGIILYPTLKTITTEDLVYDPDEEGVPQLEKEDIYVKFLGWAVTSTPTKSYLVKNIKDWGDYKALFGDGEPWFIYQYFRSFWAMNPPLKAEPADNDYQWYTWNQLSGLAANDELNPVKKLSFDMDETQTYMQENANPYLGEGETEGSDPDEPTKVIFAAQLVNSDGDALTIADWNGIYFTLPGLQNLAASMLDLYYIANEADRATQGDAFEPDYQPISGEQITFVTRSQFFNQSPLFSTTPNYTVYAVLTSAEGTAAESPIENAAGLTWYHLNENVKYENATPNDYTQINSNAVNSYIESVFGDAQVWNEGYTYYYITINHLGAKDNPGYYGVVRNHIYSATVDALSGLGTPVWDPNEPIYPEPTNPDGNNLSAVINVLSWRIVSDSYEFEW